MVKAIVGANWGDEGKGKITDVEAEKADLVVRFQGGCNAGHTIVNQYGKFALHQLPSGVFYDHVTNVIGNGVALSPEKLVQEIAGLESRGVPKPHVVVSDRAQVVMPYHIQQDTFEEARLAGKSFGSTKSGIAPFYSDKYAKIGFQVAELFDDEASIREKIDHVLSIKNVLFRELYHQPELKADDVYNQLMQYREMLEPYVADTFSLLHEALQGGKTILLEGQLGSLKDPDWGIYPMVTSSSTLAGYGAVGAGLPPYAIQDIITVVKAYSSAVGAGEFVSEVFGDEADELRHRGGDGGEFGATTGRPRRMGWLDLVATRYGCRAQGATQVAFTVLDVLGYLDEIPVCVAYDLNGKRIESFPPTPLLKHCKPIYEKLPGWKCDIRGIKKYEDLPENCRKYIEFAEKAVGVPFKMISNGPSRDDIIYR
ncbi:MULTISPECIES: adenylosuccinate synthase [Caproicibacterium]|jgi:adenylosuccinate synthase|uniref:Adenylosuccinate synthetase n=1 Tax=Caproicibacterium lactatifermentans TaxID=2666138 RepID=A0A859DQK1_9FIRM|nr:adenylosuccinate synthase [Caproicibacterium lactatifermentans]ARP50128.1 adenylosuccinate synthase [Ruminococcaceae bacterium CPB6]MDD4807565.1 adenylosuccinate synthase [Oscillospiraceae bacterium]QKN24148.1 adenylosuccinate synthase [Caproicibacterium lactatifermentans]QKO30783.1 adenylosuccinate synthase [Caproicibacterium lactatifermentans]